MSVWIEFTSRPSRWFVSQKEREMRRSSWLVVWSTYCYVEHHLGSLQTEKEDLFDFISASDTNVAVNIVRLRLFVCELTRIDSKNEQQRVIGEQQRARGRDSRGQWELVCRLLSFPFSLISCLQMFHFLLLLKSGWQQQTIIRIRLVPTTLKAGDWSQQSGFITPSQKEERSCMQRRRKPCGVVMVG